MIFGDALVRRPRIPIVGIKKTDFWLGVFWCLQFFAGRWKTKFSVFLWPPGHEIWNLRKLHHKSSICPVKIQGPNFFDSANSKKKKKTTHNSYRKHSSQRAGPCFQDFTSKLGGPWTRDTLGKTQYIRVIGPARWLETPVESQNSCRGASGMTWELQHASFGTYKITHNKKFTPN